MTREDAIKALNFFKNSVQSKEDTEVLNMAIKALEKEPRKGHWIEHPHEAGANWEFSMYECSECHALEEDDSNYCPDCGAEMREEKVILWHER